MNCENIFCIYQDDDEYECMLDEIEVDNSGMCASCIYFDIDKKVLKDAKLKLLRKFKMLDERFDD